MNQRILIVINKWWECEPIAACLLHAKARPTNVAWPVGGLHPRKRPLDLAQHPEAPIGPRLVYKSSRQREIEIWCVSDLLEDLPDRSASQSSSERKADRLSMIFQGDTPELVIAAGTAAHLEATQSLNGSVACGTKIFMHDAHPAGDVNPDSAFRSNHFEKLVDSTLEPADFDALLTFDAGLVKRFIPVPLNPGSPSIVASSAHVSLGTVNVTNSAEYKTKDPETIAPFEKLASGLSARSLETTHGLIRSASAAPFMWVSGIANGIGHFDDEVLPREYAQNFVAAHNLGIVLAGIISNLLGSG